MNPEIKAYLKQLLVDAGQTDLGEELESQMVEDLNSRLEDRLILVAMENLSDEKQDELGKMAEEKKPAGEMEAFVKENIPNWDQVFSQALIDFREVYLGRE